MSRPTFSVITVTYNSGDKLAETAASVLGQGADAEYVIVDGGSTDQSLEIARKLAAAQPGTVRLISEPDRGIYDAMNKGIGLATGRYIFFLGAGDRLLPGVLRKVEPLLPTHDRAFLYGDVKWQEKLYDGPFDWRKLCDKNVCHQGIFYGRDVFRRCGLYDLRYKVWADWEMNLRVFGRRSIVRRYIPIVIAEFELGGISGRGDPTFEQDKERLIRRHLGRIRHYRLRWPWIKQDLRSRAGRMARRIFRLPTR